MTTLFGLPMSAIMLVLVALFAVCLGGVVALWLTNRVMVRMGLRNIPRRGAQTALVVLGLMLATLIITAAFSTGDSLDYSITSAAYRQLQRNDLLLDFTGGGSGADAGGRLYVGDAVVPSLEAAFAGDPDIAGFLPYLFERAPALNPRTRLAEPSVMVAGIDTNRLGRLGGLRPVDGPGTRGAGPGTHGAGGNDDLAGLGDDEVLISEKASNKLDARTGDTLTLYVHDTPWQVRVAGVVQDELASGVFTGAANPDDAGGMAMSLPAAQRIFGRTGQVNTVTVALQGGVRGSISRSDAAARRLEGFLTSDSGRRALGLGDLDVKVETTKQDAVEQAELLGSLFTSFFLVLGLFSIAAGIMLIFLIFVMLAAERKTEMGMARAIGARRANLVQMFVAEGMAYNLLAGAVGAALGVGAAFLLVVGGARAALGEQESFLTAHVTTRSLVISYCLGAVLTFITVVIASVRVSRLNIVAAIRGTEDVRPRERRHRTRWRWVALGVAALVIPPLGWYLLLRKGLGLPGAWVWGPLGIVSGLVLVALGRSSGVLFPFALGVSLLPLSVAALARYYHTPDRPTWTAVGALLLAYWLLPQNVHNELFGKMDGNFEMFVLSGIMIVIGFTLVIVFNARLLTTLFEGAGGAGRAYAAPAALLLAAVASAALALALGDRGDGLGQLLYLPAVLLVPAAGLAAAAARFPRFGPALKMGVAYPLANRFRTGMTIAMFSLIVFSIVVMSTLNANFTSVFASDDARGGWDVVATTSASNPVDDLAGALRAEGTFDTATITGLARATALEGAREVRQAGQGETWHAYPVRAGDDAFFGGAEMKLDLRAGGYRSDRDVFEAVRTTPGLAIIDAAAVSQPMGGFGNRIDFQVKGLRSGPKELDPFQIEVRDPVTGKTGRVTVVGVLSSKIPQRVMFGLYTNEQTFAGVYGTPDYRVSYLRLVPGTDTEAAAKGIKAALLTRGVQAFSIRKVIDDQQARARGISRIFQAYLALGLLVGIAALGVIAFRSVVERRQQIGMLRAIGYRRGTVALTFLLESSFIALMGILSGVVGAAILARHLMTPADFTSAARGFSFFIPWTEVIVFVTAAYGFALLMTWWPSRGAARVPIAEALRYE